MFRTVWNWIKNHVLIVTIVAVVIVLGVIVIIGLNSSPREKGGNGKVVKAPIATSILDATRSTTPSIAVAPVAAGMTTFCFRLDGREGGHLPALMGSLAKDAYPNGLAGSNWSLSPSATGSEDYGVMADGTVFAKESFLKKYGMVTMVEIKSEITGWAAVAMTAQEIGGEAAYVYKQ